MKLSILFLGLVLFIGNTAFAQFGSSGNTTGCLATVNITPVVCNGSPTYVSIDNFPTYTSVQWSDGTFGEYALLTAGNYSVAAINTNGDTCTRDFTITEPPRLYADSIIGTNTNCWDSTGTIQFFGINGGDPDNSGNMNFTVGTLTQTHSVLTPPTFHIYQGTYNVSVVDSRGCPFDTTITITAASQEMTLIPDGPDDVCSYDSTGLVTLSVTGGVAPYQFYEHFGNQPLVGNTYQQTPGQTAYRVEDANGCAQYASHNINQYNPPNVNIQTESSCEESASGHILIWVQGNYEVHWADGFIGNNRHALYPGEYHYTLVDSNIGCFHPRVAYVDTVPAPNPFVEVEEPDCFTNYNNGSVVLTSVVPNGTYYYWDNHQGSNDPTRTMSPGSHTITMWNAHCTVTETFIVPDADPLDFSAHVTDPICQYTTSGLVTLTPIGGTGPYTFLQNLDTITYMIPQPSGTTMQYTIIDSNGCSETGNVVMPLGYKPDYSISAHGTCYNFDEGSVQITGLSGTGYGVLWANGSSSADSTGFYAGSHYVVIHDSTCYYYDTIIIEDYVEPEYELLGVDDVCADGNGVITIVPLTGYEEHEWIELEDDEMTASVPGGTYTILIESNHCSILDSVTVNETDELLVEVETISTILTANVSGGTPPYSYQWSTGDTTDSIDGAGLGPVTLSVFDANGCEAENVTVTSLHDIVRTDFALFPNPANNLVAITGFTGNVSEVEVLNIAGKVVKRIQVPQGADRIAFEVSDLATGTYVARVHHHNDRIIQNKKFVVTD